MMDAGADRSAPSLRVLVVDDSRLYREGLVHLLADGLGVDSSVVAASSLSGSLLQLAMHEPDVVIVNLASYQSDEILAAVAGRRPQAHVVVVGVDDTDQGQVIGCAEAGVSGYVTRDYSLADLIDVVRDVGAGGSHIPPRVSSALLRRVQEVALRRATPACLDNLTEREIQILRLIGAGFSNQGIADELTIELHTVKNHVHSLLTKLGVRRRGEAAALLSHWEGSPARSASPSRWSTAPAGLGRD